MIPPILAPILAELTKNGLNILAGAITAKGKEVVEETLGVDIESSMKSEEGLIKLKQLEIEHEEFLLTLAQKEKELNLKDKALDVDNTKDARTMNAKIQESINASTLAKNAAYYLDFIIIIATLVMGYILFFIEIPETNMQLLYMAFGSLITMCGTILNFHRGTSNSSKEKDVAIKALSGDRRE